MVVGRASYKWFYKVSSMERLQYMSLQIKSHFGLNSERETCLTELYLLCYRNNKCGVDFFSKLSEEKRIKKVEEMHTQSGSLASTVTL